MPGLCDNATKGELITDFKSDTMHKLLFIGINHAVKEIATRSMITQELGRESHTDKVILISVQLFIVPLFVEVLIRH